MKTLFIMSVIFPLSCLADSYSDQMAARGHLYSASQNSELILEGLNQRENDMVRVRVYEGIDPEKSRNFSGNKIHDDLIANAKEYMQTTNRVDLRSQEGASKLNDVVSSKPATPSGPNQAPRIGVNYVNDVAKNAQAVMSEIEATRAGDKYKLVQDYLNSHGAGQLFEDTLNYSETRSKSDASGIFKGLRNDPNVSNGLKGKQISPASDLAKKLGPKITKSLNDFIYHGSNFEFARQKVDEAQKAYVDGQEAAKNAPVESDAQKKANSDFFKKKNLADITQDDLLRGRYSLRPDEIHALRKAKVLPDSDKGLQIINGIRENERGFILKVAGMSNEISDGQRTGRAPSAGTKQTQEFLDKMSKKANYNSQQQTHKMKVESVRHGLAAQKIHLHDRNAVFDLYDKTSSGRIGNPYRTKAPKDVIASMSQAEKQKLRIHEFGAMIDNLKCGRRR